MASYSPSAQKLLRMLHWGSSGVQSTLRGHLIPVKRGEIQAQQGRGSFFRQAPSTIFINYHQQENPAQMQVLERKVFTKTWLTNSLRALPTGNILTSALCLAVTQTLTQAALLLSESLRWAKFINSTLAKEESDRFPWDLRGKPTSLYVSCCPAKQQTSLAELKVYSEAGWGCVPPHSGWCSQNLCPDQGPVILSLPSSYHTVLSPQCPWLLTPLLMLLVHWGHGFLPGSPPSSPPILLSSLSAKWMSLWETHWNPDHTTVPWAHNTWSLDLFLYPDSTSHTQNPHSIPNTSPIQTPSHLHSHLSQASLFKALQQYSFKHPSQWSHHLLTVFLYMLSYTDWVLNRKDLKL